jgi:hypothetical protein
MDEDDFFKYIATLVWSLQRSKNTSPLCWQSGEHVVQLDHFQVCEDVGCKCQRVSKTSEGAEEDISTDGADGTCMYLQSMGDLDRKYQNKWYVATSESPPLAMERKCNVSVGRNVPFPNIYLMVG